MKKLVTSRRMLAFCIIAAAIAGAVTLTLVKPRVSHAFTLIENLVPAVQFGPTFIMQGQTANLCAINWGDNSEEVVIGIINVNSAATTVLAHKSVTLASGGGSCLPYVEEAGHNIGGIIVVVTPSPAAVGGFADGSFADGSVRTFNGRIGSTMQIIGAMPAANSNVELLPAVQDVAPLAVRASQTIINTIMNNMNGMAGNS